MYALGYRACTGGMIMLVRLIDKEFPEATLLWCLRL